MTSDGNKVHPPNPVLAREGRPQPVLGLGVTIGIGAGVGTALGILMGNLAVGIGVGVALGAGVGAAFSEAGKGRKKLED